MKRERFHLISEVGLLLIKEGTILLSKRQNTGYADGLYHLVAGHKEKGEEARNAMVREAMEEAGLQINPIDLHLGTVIHRKVENDEERIAFFFRTDHWKGEIANKEPEKCAELKWFPIDDLPENLCPYVRFGIDQALSDNPYCAFGWEKT